MKIGIIGGAGYIGSFLYKNLSKYHDIVVYDIHKTYEHVVVARGSEISREDIQRFDVIIYLAGLSGRLSCIQHTEAEVWKENIEDIFQVGRKMNKNQLLIYASSASLMEGSKNIPYQENYNIQANLLDIYGISMYNREQKIRELDINTIGLRFGTIIGLSPTQRTNFVHIDMIRSAFLNNEIHIQHPHCCRAILWNKDLLRAIETILMGKEKDIEQSGKILDICNHEVYNLCSFNTTIYDIAANIHDKTKARICIDKDDGLFGFSMDTTRFREKYNFEFIGTPDIILTELVENIGNICIEHITTDDTCRICKNKNTTVVLDMKTQPLANNYVKSPCIQHEYPLCLIRCKDCMHTQLNYTVKPEVMFKNYQYVSGTSCTLREYCFHFTQKCIKDTEYTGGTVLELACNDGSQLDEFRKLGWDTYGVDPAQNIIIEGQQKGHKVCCGFWGHDNFPLIPTPDIIIAQNVFAHVPDPIQFMNHCARVMKDHTYLYIQTSQCNMYQNGEFDTIYHEHLSFFTIASMMKAVEICDLIITEITKQPIHGTSYLFQIRKRSSIITKHSEQALKMYREEADIGLYTDQFYEDYNRKVVNIKEWVFSKITEFKQKNIPFVGYGAAAKGMTLLNFFDIQNLEYIADDAILKHNKYTPGKNIRIVPPSWLGKDKRELVVFVFAWNFMKEILQKITLLRKGVSTYIIQPFPEQIVYHIQCDGTIHIL